MSDEVENFLAHYGVLGMRWGHRSSNYSGASSRTNREAKKDAAEFARAKMFYGEGAGTRRKLIKATVEAKAKKDPTYKGAFDHHLAAQDLGKHASKARGERKRKDRTEGVAKTARGVNRGLNGGFGSVPLTAAVIVGGVGLARQTGVDKVVADAAMTKLRDVQNDRSTRKAADEFLRRANAR